MGLKITTMGMGTKMMDANSCRNSGVCLGHWVYTDNGREFDCGYEFAGEITCEGCMYGPFNGIRDPGKSIKEDE